MKKKYYSILFISLFSILLLAGCSGNKSEKKQDSKSETVTPDVPAIIGSETTSFLIDLEENGNYVKSREFPSLIKASIVNEEMGKKNLIIDLRPASSFSEGHIKGAVNKPFKELPQFFETGIKPFEYDKIIMVCNDGQVSSYATCLLRLKGYGNVYAMRWGMSSWNKKYAGDGWLQGVSGKYETRLDTSVSEIPPVTAMPELKTGLATGKEIGEARFKKLFDEGTDSILITAEKVFNNPGKYFIINLERKDKYEDGHIPGAVRYKPESTLGFTNSMATIPFDKTIVVYCGTGHNSGFATAYLRLFGYDAKTLKYGNNGFMHDKMVKQRTALSWLPFTLADVNNFAVVR